MFSLAVPVAKHVIQINLIDIKFLSTIPVIVYHSIKHFTFYRKIHSSFCCLLQCNVNLIAKISNFFSNVADVTYFNTSINNTLISNKTQDTQAIR